MYIPASSLCQEQPCSLTNCLQAPGLVEQVLLAHFLDGETEAQRDRPPAHSQADVRGDWT